MSRKKPKAAAVVSLSCGYDAGREIVIRLEPDPEKPGARAPVAVNIRHDPITHMHAAGRISDAERAAGEKFRALYAKAGMGTYGSFDYSRDMVDCGGKGDPMTESVVHAGRELAKAARALGMVGYTFVQRWAGECKSVRNIAGAWREMSDPAQWRAEAYVSERIIEALRELVQLWGMEAKGKERATIRVGLAEYRPRRTDRRLVPAELLRPAVGAMELTVADSGDLVEIERRA